MKDGKRAVRRERRGEKKRERLVHIERETETDFRDKERERERELELAIPEDRMSEIGSIGTPPDAVLQSLMSQSSA